MHSFSYDDPEGVHVSMHYNSDLSGDVIVLVTREEQRRLNTGLLDDYLDDSDDDVIAVEVTDEIRVPGRALLEFVAEHLRRRYISQLEDADTDTILGLIEGDLRGV